MTDLDRPDYTNEMDKLIEDMHALEHGLSCIEDAISAMREAMETAEEFGITDALDMLHKALDVKQCEDAAEGLRYRLEQIDGEYSQLNELQAEPDKANWTDYVYDGWRVIYG